MSDPTDSEDCCELLWHSDAELRATDLEHYKQTFLGYKPSDNPFECWISQAAPCSRGKSKKKSDYTQVTCPKDKRSAKLHQIAAWHRNGGYVKGLDASHLCKNARCFRPSHLVLESRSQNLDRKSCHGYVVDRKSGVVIRTCQHEPRCIDIFEGCVTAASEAEKVLAFKQTTAERTLQLKRLPKRRHK
jgi:hypothetical protein